MADATNRDRATNHRGRLAGLAALLVLLTIPALPTMRLDQMPAARAAQDVMHVPLGAAVVLVLHAVLGGFRRRLFVSLMFAGAALVSLELVQGVLATGQPSWGDVFLDALGMAWAVALVGIRGRTTGGGRALWVALLAVVALALPAARLWSVGRSEAARLARLPVIADFERDGDLPPWRGTGGMTIAPVDDSGSRVLRCDFAPGERPAVLLTYPPADWSGYGRLLMRARSLTGEPLRLTLKVTDLVEWRDFDHRHTRPMTLTPEWSTIVVELDGLVTPSGRVIDRSRVNTLVWFIRGADHPGAFALDDLRLEP
jgi:hypothetical protein